MNIDNFPHPRDFQTTAIASLREGVRLGHRCQVLMSPTGSGKSWIGLRLAFEAAAKGKRAIFICDRRTLIRQTARSAWNYGVRDQGIVMSDDWANYRPDAKLQISSAQTLDRREWPEADLIIIDECHSLMTVWTDHIQTTQAVVVGLSATPFAKGMGKLFSRVVNAATMANLTNDGILVPMRIYTCVRPDMTGAKTVGGEWSDKEAEKRGAEIIGDVVEQWKKLAEDRKTIVFGSTIAHCEMLCKQFNESRIPATLFTSKTTETERKDILADFEKPDSYHKVLISVEALCVDSETEILTRDGWKKRGQVSLTDKVASYCASTGKIQFHYPKSIVDRPLGADEKMVSVKSKLLSWRVTDNHRMLVGQGAVKGSKWKFRTAADVAGVHGISMPVAGYAEADIFTVAQAADPSTSKARRISANSYNLRKQGFSAEQARQESIARIEQRDSLRFKNPDELTLDECRLIGFWLGDGSKQNLKTGGVTYTFVQSQRYHDIVEWFDQLLSRIGLHATRKIIAKEKIEKAGFDVVKWQVCRGTGFGSQNKSGLYHLEPYLHKDGTDLFWGFNRDQFIALLEGFHKADGIHHRQKARSIEDTRITNTNKGLLDLLQAVGVTRGCYVRITEGSKARIKNGFKPIYYLAWNPSKTFVTSAAANAKVEDRKDESVWCVETVDGTLITRRNGRPLIMGNCKGFDVPDIGCVVDCRPLRKSLSTAIQMWGRGLRSSPSTGKKDCILIDHSGNIVRFAKDFERIFHDGLDDLDSGERLDKTVRKDEEEEHEAKACPQCGFSPFRKTCMSCGYEKKSIEEIKHEVGDAVEFSLTKSKTASKYDKQRLWSELIGYQQEIGYAKGWAAHQYKEKTGVWPRGLNDTPIPPSPELARWIRSKNIKFHKGMAKRERLTGVQA